LKPSGIGILDHNVSRFLSVSCQAQKISNAAHQATLEQGVCEFLIQQTNERIVVLTSDFKIVEANGPYFKAVGKSREEVIGAYCYKSPTALRPLAPCLTRIGLPSWKL
jgi:PAS domain-containing protein